MGLNTVHCANPEPSILLGKARKGGRDTQRSVGNTALSPRSLPSGKGRDEQSHLSLCLWWGGSLKLREVGPTRGGREHLDRLPGEAALLVLPLWRDSSPRARPLSRDEVAAVAGNPGLGPVM